MRRKAVVAYGVANDLRTMGIVRDTVAKARSYPLHSDSRRSFVRSLSSINRWKRDTGRITIYPDFCEYSFCWQAGLYGGFIFHKNVEEWSVHT